MNYYDEEISITGPDSKNLSTIKMDRISSLGSASGSNSRRHGSGASQGQSEVVLMNPKPRQRIMTHGNSTDDDGLLQDILDHDDEDDDDEDDDEDSHMQGQQQQQQQQQQASSQKPKSGSAATRHSTSVQRPTSTRMLAMPSAKALDNDTDPSESESEEEMATGNMMRGQGMPLRMSTVSGDSLEGTRSQSVDNTLTITPDMWEQLPVHKEIKDLFPFILKYTPQHIELPYHLQPFIPEYVPAVGDVDAFLKVSVPPLGNLDTAVDAAVKEQHQREMDEHVSKMGLYFLDEPSGEQSEPSLLNMKLRSVLSGSVSGRRGRGGLSSALVPIAKSAKDMDKWVNEIEEVHMAHAIYDAQPRKDIDALIVDWPRQYATRAAAASQDAYQRCMRDDISLKEYIDVLCREFEIDGESETQADYILNVHTLFSLYLAASQAWE